MLDMEQLCACDLFREQYMVVRGKWPALDMKRTKHELIRRMINKVVVDLVRTSLDRITRHSPVSIEDVRKSGEVLIRLSEEVREQHLQLKQFLYSNLYRHERVMQMTVNATAIITRLFNVYMQDPATLSPDVQVRIGTGNPELQKARVIADYIAGMTDRFAIYESQRLGQ